MPDLQIAQIRQEDPYWGLDITLVRTMAGLFNLIGVLFAVALWPLSPVSNQIGNAGWAIGGGMTLAGLVVALLILKRPSIWTYRSLAMLAFASVFAISIAQWLAGGSGAPYETLLLIPVLFICALYPPRVSIAFLALCGVSLGAPLVYDQVSGNLAANAVGPFLLMIAGGAAVHYLLLQIRTQRVAMAEGEKSAHAEARVDELTAIGNRRAFGEALSNEVSRAERMGTPLSLAMGDIDRFKQINDDFGHLEGDRALHSVAQAMEGELRIPDRVFRWGGDEFALLLPGTPKEGAAAVIERIQSKVCVACRRPDNSQIWIHFAAAELVPQMSAADLRTAADLALMAERSRSRHGTRT